jgi:DNA-binding XRE family transcriptional regulator
LLCSETTLARRSASVEAERMSERDELARAIKLFGAAVRERRQEIDLSQNDLMRATGIHRTHISRIERGLVDPMLETICTLATGLLLTPGELCWRATEDTERLE